MASTDERVEEDEAVGLAITPAVLLAAFLGGALGLVAMVPVLVGLPAFLGLFQAEPLLDVARLGRVLGVEPNLAAGVLVFALGGAVALPLLFVVAGAFLPPREPRWARAVSFALVMWTGFAVAFWPGQQAAVLFLALSLLGHVVYGVVLGAVLEFFAYVPEHEV